MTRPRILLAAASVVLLSLAVLWWIGRPISSVPIVNFQVRRGLSAHEIARDLHDEGVMRHPWTFLFWVKLGGAKAIRPGVYDLSTHASGLSIYRQLLKGPPLVRIVEPDRTAQYRIAGLQRVEDRSGRDWALHL